MTFIINLFAPKLTCHEFYFGYFKVIFCYLMTFLKVWIKKFPFMFKIVYFYFPVEVEQPISIY